MDGEDIGDEFKGYVFKIMGGQDKQGFSMKQGVLTQDRVRLMMSKGAPLPALTVGAGGGSRRSRARKVLGAEVVGRSRWCRCRSHFSMCEIQQKFPSGAATELVQALHQGL